MEEERKEKKTIKCSYAFLVIILCACVAFLTDYIVIDRKTRTCNCPKCGNTKKEIINDNALYNYEDVAGIYKANQSNSNEECSYTLVLSNDGLFRYSYGCGWSLVHYGNYFIKNDKIYLNDVFSTRSDPSVVIHSELYELSIENNRTIHDENSMAKDNTHVDFIDLFFKEDESRNIRDDYKYLLQDKVVDLMKYSAKSCENAN